MVAIAAPTDGQTGMVVFPLWFLGGALMIVGMATSFLFSGKIRWISLVLIFIAGLFVWRSFVAAEAAVAPQEAKEISQDQ